MRGVLYRAQRGSMLVLTLLILLALTSVAMVAVHLTSTELSAAGNTRRGVTTFRVTESGAFSALAYAHSLGPEGFIQKVESAPKDDQGRAIFESEDLVSGISYFDMSARGSFGYEGFLLNANAGSQSPADFDVRVKYTGMRQPILGYSASGPGSRCRFKYRFEANGDVGDHDSHGEPGDAAYAVWQKITTEVYIGPLPCDQGVAGAGSI